jgi:uncharacterized membrane protein
MSLGLVLILACGMGAVGGLRSMTAPAVTAWAAHLGWLPLAGSPLAFMSSPISVGIFTACALGEFIGDLLPAAPARTSPFPLIVRILVGGFTGACLAVAGRSPLGLGAVAGAIGAVAGAFGGYRARLGLVQRLHCADAWVAIPEDFFAAGVALLMVCRFR